MKVNRFTIFCCMLMISTASVFAQSDLQVLAVIKLNKSESITVKQLKTRVGMYEKQAGRVLTVDERKQTLDALISEKLINQAAQKAGISIPDSAVNQNFLQWMSQIIVGGNDTLTEQELNAFVRQQTKTSLDEFMKQQAGMSIAEYKEYLKAQITAQQYIQQQREAELRNVKPTDEDIRSFYEMNKANFVWSDMLRLFLVIVPKGSSPDDAKAKATEMWNTLKNAKDPSSVRTQIRVRAQAEKSGFQAGEMLINKTETSAVKLGISYRVLLELFSRTPGYISDVQDNETNYQFYSIVEKYDAKLLGLSDVVYPGTTITVYNYIKDQLGRQQQMAYMYKAVNEIAKSLDVSENVDRKKTGAELDKLLSW